jgi:hypothetical protein
VVAAVLAISVPTAKADPGGASVERYDTCTALPPPPGQFCSWADIEHNVTQASSGNLSDEANGSLGYAVTAPWGDTYSYSYATHAHFLYKDLFLHEQEQQILSETKTSFSDCVIAAHYHQVGFDLQFINVTVQCTPIT